MFEGDSRKAIIFVKFREIISKQLSVDESDVKLNSHLSSDFHVGELDLLDIIAALEENFDIEISEHEYEKDLDIIECFDLDWTRSSLNISFKAGERCVVNNFIEFIDKKSRFSREVLRQ
jgi:acyl carrier protein